MGKIEGLDADGMIRGTAITAITVITVITAITFFLSLLYFPNVLHFLLHFLLLHNSYSVPRVRGYSAVGTGS